MAKWDHSGKHSESHVVLRAVIVQSVPFHSQIAVQFHWTTCSSFGIFIITIIIASSPNRMARSRHHVGLLIGFGISTAQIEEMSVPFCLPWTGCGVRDGLWRVFSGGHMGREKHQ